MMAEQYRFIISPELQQSNKIRQWVLQTNDINIDPINTGTNWIQTQNLEVCVVVL